MTRQLPRTIHHSQTTPPVLSSLWRKVDQLDDGLKSEGEWEDDEVSRGIPVREPRADCCSLAGLLPHPRLWLARLDRSA